MKPKREEITNKEARQRAGKKTDNLPVLPGGI
jgi:hypothetical protein